MWLIILQTISKIIISPPKYLKSYLKSVFCYKKWKKCLIIVILIIILIISMALVVLGLSVYKPLMTQYINRAFNHTTAVEQVTEMMEQLVKSCDQGTTISWMRLSSNLENSKKELRFEVVRTCDYDVTKDCISDSKLRFPGFYNRIYPLSEKDGELIESDQLELGYTKYDFTELKVITIPVFENGAMSPQIIGLKFKAPDLYRILSKMPLALRRVKYLFAAKARDVTKLNTRVIDLILVNRWGNNKAGCSEEGLKQSASILIKYIKESILLI